MWSHLLAMCPRFQRPHPRACTRVLNSTFPCQFCPLGRTQAVEFHSKRLRLAACWEGRLCLASEKELWYPCAHSPHSCSQLVRVQVFVPMDKRWVVGPATCVDMSLLSTSVPPASVDLDLLSVTVPLASVTHRLCRDEADDNAAE